jgi:signal transduction histidine kinase
MCPEQLAEQVEELKERLEAEVSRREAAEEMAAKLSCLKSSLLTNMSHELRTPLTSILAHASILERKLDGDAHDSAQSIKRSGERLTETLNSVLTLAQLEGKVLEPVSEDVDLAALLDHCVESLRPLACQKGLWLRTSLEDTLQVYSDPRYLRRILTNLIGNAIKFTNQGGVSVSIHAGDELVLEVSDTGVGINDGFLDDLFEPFTQESSGLTRTHQGTGLGLAVTRHLVQSLGGEIEVDSQKGSGTAFTVRLDCAKVCTSHTACGPTSSAPTSHQQK